MARISLNPPRTLPYRMFEWYARRKFGAMVDPAKIMGHNMRVLSAYGMFEGQVLRWRAVDVSLKDLAVMAASVAIGCEWCLDFGYWESHAHGVPREKLEAIPRWRDSDVFDERERLVLEFAEAMTDTPPTVTDELVDALREHFTEAQLVELSAIIALENQRSRFNAAFGLSGQGFKDRCELRPAPRVAERGAAS